MLGPDPDPKLTALCDEKTLQEDERGFFKSIVENIYANSDIREWTQDVFPHTFKGADYVKNLLSRNETRKPIMEMMTVSEVYRKKDEREAIANIVKAEMLLKNDGDTKEIMALCCRAVIKSSQPSAALRLRAICLKDQGKIVLAARDLEYALKYLESDKLTEFQKKLKNTIEEQFTSITNSECFIEQSLWEKLAEEQIKEDKDEKQFPLKIGIDNIQGRYMITENVINPGDTVLEERPYATCLKSQFFGSYCHHCLDKLEAAIGCADCSCVAFCSEKCKQLASNTYHKYECKFMDLFIGSGMSVLCSLALRMLTQIGLQESLKIYQDNFKDGNDEKMTKIFDRTTKTGRIATIYSLNTHETFRVQDDFIKRVLMAIFLTRCLRKANFFSTESKKDELYMSETELKICTMLLYNIQMLEFNAHEIKPRGGPRETGIACAIYATASLFNHDCTSPLARYFKGSSLILKSVRPVFAGSPIGDNYGPRYGVRSINNGDRQHSTSGRRRILRSRYRFYCQCDACQQDWPDVDSLQDQPVFRCDKVDCDGKITEDSGCDLCGKFFSEEAIKKMCNQLFSCLMKYEEGRDLRTTDKYAAKKILCESISKFHNIAFLPHKPTLDAEDIFNKCMASDY